MNEGRHRQPDPEQHPESEHDSDARQPRGTGRHPGTGPAAGAERGVGTDQGADTGREPRTESAAYGDLDDRALLEAHRNGDPTAFAALIARHRNRMWAVALRVMRNPEDAADAVQDACVAAFRRSGSFRGEAQVTTWLHRVVLNACFDRLRSIRARAAEPLPDDLERSLRLGTPATDDPLEVKERREVVAAAMGRLNPDQRAALVLVDMEGYSVDEAARMLGCAPGTVKSRCARGRARLAPLLAGFHGARGAREGEAL